MLSKKYEYKAVPTPEQLQIIEYTLTIDAGFGQFLSMKAVGILQTWRVFCQGQ
jgi:hypothetical protein